MTRQAKPRADPGEKKRGGRRGWATEEQDVWLRNRVTSYMAAQATGAKSLAEFWPVTWEAWFTKWPEPTPIMLPPPASSTENEVAMPTVESLVENNIRARKTVSTIHLK
jgi:hypothetical protein